jgi:hypothetical protein
VFYFPSIAFLNPHGALADWPVSLYRIRLVGLEPELTYTAYYFNPRTGDELARFEVTTRSGDYLLPRVSEAAVTPNPTGEDWVLVLERQSP